MALRIRVCRADAVPPGDMRAFAVPELPAPILVLHVDGRLYAASSVCPHEQVSLAGGQRAGATVTCPGHGYQFDLTTGRCNHDPGLRLPCYRTTVENGVLYVELAGA